MKRLPLIVLAASLAFVTPAAAQETPRMGGVLKVASIGEPPTLDIPMSTATLVYEIMWHVNESLFTYDKSFNPVPLLADSWTLTDKGLKYTINLRKAVKFHNGKEMTSADVVPSLQRWGRVASVGRALWKYVESVDAKDPYTVVISMKQPSSSLIYGLSEPARGHLPEGEHRGRGRGPAQGVHRHRPVPLRRAPPGPAHQAGQVQGLQRARGARRAASGASAPPTSTRSCSSPCPRPRCAWPASRPASTTTRCSSSRTPTSASRACPRSSRGSSSRAAGPSRS